MTEGIVLSPTNLTFFLRREQLAWIHSSGKAPLQPPFNFEQHADFLSAPCCDRDIFRIVNETPTDLHDLPFQHMKEFDSGAAQQI
jgi:hypothetical protein